MKRIMSLEYLRVIMLGIIILSHFEFVGAVFPFYNKYLHNPTMGVDYFFMLSGFGTMLSKKILEGENNKIRACIRNALFGVSGIYVLYILLQFVMIPFYLYTGGTIINTVIKLLVSITLLQSATGIQSFSHAFNSVSWFLSSLFCINLIALPIKRIIIVWFRKAKVFTIILFIIGCSMLNSGLNLLFSYIEMRSIFNMLSYVSPYIRVWNFIIGMLIGTLFLKTKDLKEKPILYSTQECLSLIGGGGIWFIAKRGHSEWWMRFIDLILCAYIIYVFANERGCISYLMSKSKILLSAAKITIPLYLIHYVVRCYVGLGFETLNISGNGIGMIAECVLILTISILLSAIYDRNKELFNLKKYI